MMQCMLPPPHKMSLLATPTERHRLWGQATQRDAHAGGRRTWGAFRGAPAAAARFVVVGADDPEMPKSMVFAERSGTRLLSKRKGEDNGEKSWRWREICRLGLLAKMDGLEAGLG